MLSVEVSAVGYRSGGFAVGAAAPRLSWIIRDAPQDWRQTAYEVTARGERKRVESGESVLVPWPFAPLKSRERLDLRVRVWGEDGTETAWSPPIAVEAALLELGDWSARFVSPAVDRPSPRLRREFALRGPVARARLYVTALGVYELEINGRRVGDEVLAPGWTSYDHRLAYQTHDVTELLRVGPNAIGASLGDGWYRGHLGFRGGRRCVYGDRLALLAQLEVEYADGTTERVVTDESWGAAGGPVLAADLYGGESYDARREWPGWSMPGHTRGKASEVSEVSGATGVTPSPCPSPEGRGDDEWGAVEVVERDLSTLFAQVAPPVRRIEELRPVAIAASPSGKTIVDFGQNLVGWVRLTVDGPAGTTITLRHAEVLEDGELCTRPLRLAKATDEYTLRGGAADGRDGGPETWEPRFTFHGFRYVEVSGWPGELRTDDVVAVVVHTDLERRGWFECSDPLLSRFHENVVWSMRGNFLSIPTDCPQRDERLGWTGDIQVFGPAACFLYDADGFLASWLRDLAADQDPDGGVPWVVPNPLPGPLRPAAAWGDAAVIVPWTLCERYGDLDVLAAQHDSMRAWVDWISRRAGPARLWRTGHQFGDWLDPDAPPEYADRAKTDKYLVATAYFAHSARLVGRASERLGRSEDAARYAALADEVRAAFQRAHVGPDGRMTSDAPTAYALAIAFDLLPEWLRPAAGRRLAELVREHGYRISTGFVGTPLICDALCAIGEEESAYRLLTQRECPSWLYPLTMGATTIWERWDSLRPDGSVNPGEMTSFNHYALGAVVDWMHRRVAGLAPAEPGYRRLRIAPIVGGGLTFARARHVTPYGEAACGWELRDGQVELTVWVPANARAEVHLPTGVVEVGSGEHAFTYPLAP